MAEPVRYGRNRPLSGPCGQARRRRSWGPCAASSSSSSPGCRRSTSPAPPRCSAPPACFSRPATRSRCGGGGGPLATSTVSFVPDVTLEEMSGPDRHPHRRRRHRRAPRRGGSVAGRVDRRGGEALAAGGLRLHRRLPARQGGAARRPPRHHALGQLRRPGRALSRGDGRAAIRSSCATATSPPPPGVTAGMDLALALVEEDLGRDVALEAARWLVVFLQRPGGQAQFSAQLAAQTADRAPLRELQAWIPDHLDEDLSVPALARRACMSDRNFARAFRRETGHDAGRLRGGRARRARPDRARDGRPAGRGGRRARPASARSRRCGGRSGGRWA